MKTKGRFYNCEREGFPPVNNYDYTTNLPIRGIGNLDFRWEEVSAESVYLLLEATVNGSFESNTFVSDFSITDPTSVNYITTTGTNLTSYSGWNLSGSSTIYIGISGLFVNSGELVGLDSGFYAHPIEGDEAIGLYKDPGSSDNPCIYSDLISTGTENNIILNNRHQHYLSFKLNYGANVDIRSYIRGYLSGEVVCHYNPQESIWQVLAPTGYFTFSGTKYQELVYDFTTIDFPTQTPEQFDVYVESLTSGSFVTIDSLHIDAYMRRNAFLDFIVPTGYVIQITPDLGWHNILEMFDGSKMDIINPHLITLGPYSIENGNLIDNRDNSVSAIIDESDINKVVTNDFRKYLWRALPLSPNGQVQQSSTEKSYPQKFEFIKNISVDSFSITSIDNEENNNIFVINGKKPKNSVVLLDDEEVTIIEYPTSTSWRCSINLTVPSQLFKFQARHTGGALSSFIKVKLDKELQEQNDIPLWNVFDDHGVFFDIERLPNESNHDYSLRLLDYNRNLPGPSFEGIVNGSSRELGISKIPEALTFILRKTTNNTYIVPSLEVSVTAYSLRIHTPDMVKTERVRVDNIHKTIYLSDLPKEDPEQAIIDDSYKIKLSKILNQDIFEDISVDYSYKLDITDSAEIAEVTYSYYKEFLFKNYKTIFELKTALESIISTDGNRFFDIIVSPKLSGNESTLGLFIGNQTIANEETITIPWCSIFLKRISDRGYRDYFLVDTDNLRETSYYSFVKEIKDNLKLFWGSVESDRSVWDPVDTTELSMDSIPTLFDPKITNFISKDGNAEKRIESINLWAFDYVGYSEEIVKDKGLRFYLFQPGIGSNNDLSPGVTTDFSYIKSESFIAPNIGPVRNIENTTVYFSGEV